MPRSFTPNSPLTFDLMHDDKISHQEAGARRITSVVPGRARPSSTRRGEICDGGRRTDAPYPLITDRSRGRPMNRWVIAVAGITMQIALGAVYAWSVFRIPLTRAYGWSISQVTLTFELTILMLG